MNERDLLISRIVDREDRDADWVSFERSAIADSSITDDLVAALHDDARLRELAGPVRAAADTVALPRVRQWLPHWRSAQWSGWWAAAVVVLCWAVVDARRDRPEAERSVPTAFDPADSPPRAQTAGSELVRELPNLLVETRALPGSDDVEVVFLRRSVERAVVSRAVEVSHDESGQPFETRVDLTRFATQRNY